MKPKHRSLLNSAIQHNKKDEQKKSFHITYRKQSTGRVVKRKVSPYEIKGGLLVAYDHKRKSVRTYRTDRISHLKADRVSNTLKKIGTSLVRKQRPQVLVFHADWCGPCREHVPAVKRMESKFPGLEFRYINIDHDHATVKKYGVKTIPHVSILRDGKSVDHYTGRQPESEMNKFFRKHELQMEKSAFWQGFEKKANHVAEIAGLGLLAVPSIKHLRGKPLSEDTAHKFELGGLGVLAAPSLANLGGEALKYMKGAKTLGRLA